MNRKARILKILLIFLAIDTPVFAQAAKPIAEEWKLPLETKTRKNLVSLSLGKNAGFMAKRNKHLHTGIDIVNHGPGEKVYAASAGEVVSIYAREPNKAVMIQHKLPSGESVWTVYVHVTRIEVGVGDIVSKNTVLAHLMNRDQLNEYGWVYNHLHFEVLKKPRINHIGKYLSYSTRCRTEEEVERHFFDPVKFLENVWLSERKD